MYQIFLCQNCCTEIAIRSFGEFPIRELHRVFTGTTVFSLEAPANKFSVPVAKKGHISLQLTRAGILESHKELRS